jgi:hypothetical protein
MPPEDSRSTPSAAESAPSRHEGPVATRNGSAGAVADTASFLRLVLPSQGWLAVVTAREKHFRPAELFATVDELSAAIERYDRDRYTTYFCTAALRDPGFVNARGKGPRCRENVAWKRGLYADVDLTRSIGNGDREAVYPSKLAIVERVFSFCTKVELPFPIAVITGGGCHFHWPLTRDVTPREWYPLAKSLQQAMLGENIVFDANCSVDSVHVFRPPGTRNFKYSPPPEVGCASLDHEPIDPDHWPLPLAPIAYAKSQPQPLAFGRRPKPAFLASEPNPSNERFRARSYSPSDPWRVIADCAQMRRLQETMGRETEPIWQAQLNVLTFCEGGDAVAHEFSKGDVRYDFAEVQDKLDRARATGPAGCEHFEGLDVKGCEGCRWKGYITTPLELGRLYANGEDAGAQAEPDGQAGQEGSETGLSGSGAASAGAAGAAGISSKGGAGKRVTIEYLPGELAQTADKCEEALTRAGYRIYVRPWERGYTLTSLRPDPVPAMRGGTTTQTQLYAHTTETLQDWLSRTIDLRTLRNKKMVPIDPPDKLAKLLLSRAVNGDSRFPVLDGIIQTPTLRPDGSLLDEPGYDLVMRLYLALDPDFRWPGIPEAPTGEDALRSMALFEELLVDFPFVASVDRAVALSALLTPLVRGIMPTAPLHAISAPQPGSGKTYLMDLASLIATGESCPATSAGQSEEELEKRLSALLLRAPQIVALDNCDHALGGEFLEMAMAKDEISIRILGRSQAPRVKSRSTHFATGNNLRLTGAMPRRSVISRLDARLENPETRPFRDPTPEMRVRANRGLYVAGGLTVMRYWQLERATGQRVKCSPLGGYEQWSQLVREPLIALGYQDPVKSQEWIRSEDPTLGDLKALRLNWPGEPRQVLTAKQLAGFAPGSDPLGEVLERIAGTGRGGYGDRYSVSKLGQWLARHAGHVVDNWRLELGRDKDGHRYWFSRVAPP